MEVIRMEKMISVIIPVYNAEQFIGRCLDSIINQTYKNLQIICVNDCSKDSSLEILLSYAEKDSRISVIDVCQNRGVSSSRNTGIENALGDYLIFIDADDFIEEHCIEILYNQLQNENAICVGKLKYLLKAEDFEKISSDKEEKAVKYRYDDAININDIKAGACNKLYPKSLIGEIRFVEQLKYGEDTLFNINIISKRKANVILVNKTTYYYDRTHDSSTSTTPISEFYKYVQVLIDEASIDDLIVSDAVKSMLSLRYMAKVNNDKSTLLEIRRHFKHFTNKLLNVKCMSAHKKLVMLIFIKFPFMYRYYRISNDKSLLEYEKRVKANAK